MGSRPYSSSFALRKRVASTSCSLPEWMGVYSMKRFQFSFMVGLEICFSISAKRVLSSSVSQIIESRMKFVA